MQLVTPRVVAIAVTIDTMSWIISFHVFLFSNSYSTLLPKDESIKDLEIIQRQLEIVLCREAGVSQIAVYAAHGKPRLLAVGGVCLEYDSQCCASYRQVLIQNSGANITIFADVGKLFARKCYFHPQPMGEPEVGCHKNHAAQGQEQELHGACGDPYAPHAIR